MPRPLKTPLAIGVSAEAFGFGPASKAAAVLHHVMERAPALITILADSVAHEFLQREGFKSPGPLHPSRQADLPAIDSIVSTLHGVVVALDPAWATYLSKRVPTLFIDSLGFMWAPEHFSRNSDLLAVQIYAAQDVFDSVARLREIGIKHLVPVGAIVTVKQERARSEETVIHLGGLVNIFSSETGLAYLDFAVNLLRPLFPTGQNSSVRLLTSERVPQTTALGNFKVTPAPHSEAVALFASVRRVYTSPGLTTLLELAALQTPVIPLPPQNFSQALIIRNLTHQFQGLPDVWSFLAEAYSVPYGISEKEGVSRVTELNSRYARSDSFAAEYRELALVTSDSAVPRQLAPDYDGAEQCASLLLEVIAKTST